MNTRIRKSLRRKSILALITAMASVVIVGLFIPRSDPPVSGADSEADDNGPKTKTYPNESSPLGINLTPVEDWSTEMVFVDVFMHSRQWISQQKGKPWGQGPPLELSDRGWIQRLKHDQFATTFMCREIGGHYPAGRYVCLYEGEGILEFGGDARIATRSPGRIELDVIPGEEGIILEVLSINPENPIRDLHVIMPGFEEIHEKEPFHPNFLARCQNFKVLRFMDWMLTNHSESQDWQDRPSPEDASQAYKGVAVEYMIDLCNRLHSDPWFCMPHLATDEYVRNFAEMARDRLEPDLRLYIEHSNEVWNSRFEQFDYSLEQGEKRKLSNDDFRALLFYHSKRSVEIFGIFEEVFGGTDRLVRVLGSQASNPWVSQQVMEYEDAYRHADAIAIAPYFGYELGTPEHAKHTQKMTVEEVLAACRKSILENQKLLSQTVRDAQVLGLEVIAYEGGQHLVGVGGAENDQKLSQLFVEANRHPGMKQLYSEDLASWKEAGGKLFVVFSSVGSFSKWGSWGILEHEDQDTNSAPKYQAIKEFIENDPRWWK